MGNQSSDLQNGAQPNNVPTYPRYFDIGSEHEAKPCAASAPHMARMPQMPPPHQLFDHDDASPRLPDDSPRRCFQAFAQISPSLNFDLIDAESSPMCPAPVPGDGSSPVRRYHKISSYAVPKATLRRQTRHVKFASSPTHSVHCSEIGVPPYSEIYGMHPRKFDFDEFGNKIARTSSSARPFMQMESRMGRQHDVEDYQGHQFADNSEWGDW